MKAHISANYTGLPTNCTTNAVVEECTTIEQAQRVPEPSHVPAHPRANVLGIQVDAVDMQGALQRIHSSLQSGDRGYVCALGVHGVMEARRDPLVARAFGDAFLVVPDGTPMAWVGRCQGHRRMQPVPGPELMLRVFGDPRFGRYSHFFYGGKPGVAEELAEKMHARFPSTRIAGTYTPPFRELTLREQAQVVRQINNSNADIVWVGISTPRQDLWMQRMLPKLGARLLFGVGAAFDFNTGHIMNCAPWVKRAGFHWLHRLLQDPRRLWRRNLANIPFIWQIALQLSGITNPAELLLNKASDRCDRTAVQTR